jgi:putative membrane protein
MRGYANCIAALPAAHKMMLLALLLAVGLANVRQSFPDLAPLQHIPTVMLCIAAPVLLRRWPISTGSLAALWVFMLLHTLGGRYIYSYVPYDAWAEALTGHSLSSLFGWSRNHYDRLIHFCFGLFWTLPICEAIVRRHGVTRGLGLVFGFAMVGLVSALYEIFEWALTIVAAGDTADYYNGQQGDIWDAQKDMAMAQFGSIIAVIWTKIRPS